MIVSLEWSQNLSFEVQVKCDKFKYLHRNQLSSFIFFSLWGQSMSLKTDLELEKGRRG